MKAVPISLPADLRQFADKQCQANHESLAAYIRRLILEDQRRSPAQVDVEKCGGCGSTSFSREPWGSPPTGYERICNGCGMRVVNHHATA